MNIYPELEGVQTIGQRSLFEKRAIEGSSRRGIEPQLLERSLHCLEYVGRLVSGGLDFVFKGGTACQLLVGKDVQRLSIDIDISTKATEGEVRELLRTIEASVGNRAYNPTDVPKKGLDKVPLLMFNISAPTYYPSQKPTTMIKLDVVLRVPTYETVLTPLSMFYYESPLKVRTPSVGSMLGDKLSTLGPRTIGLRADLPVDNIKQFYDIGSLLALDYDRKIVKRAHQACFKEVSSWRELSVTYEEALEDLVDWCKVASAVQFIPPGTEKERMGHANALARGIDGFAGYIARDNLLTRRRLREVASRAALLARILKETQRFEKISEFIKGPERFQDVVLKEFRTIHDGICRIPIRERWHIHIAEFKNNPLAMAAWFGHWDPESFERLLSEG